MDPPNARQHRLLSFSDGVTLREDPSGMLLQTRLGTESLEAAPDAVQAAARALTTGRHTASALMAQAPSPLQLLPYLRRWDQLGLLSHTVASSEGALATLVPTSPGFEPRYASPDTETEYIWSRFALCRRIGRQLVAESSVGHARVVLHHQRASAIVHALSTGASLEGLGELFDHPDSLSLLVGLLLDADLVTPLGPDGHPADDGSPMRSWEFHDLLFHARSRRGRHSAPCGRTERLRDTLPPSPAIKPAMSDQRISLPVPDPAQIERHDMPLSTAMDARRSLRAHGPNPITTAQLSEFLYRTARNYVHDQERDHKEDGGESSRSYEHIRRPYPSGGACYELELYPVVRSCDGVPPSLYHYHSGDHALYRVRALDGAGQRLLDEAHHALGTPQGPQILVVLAARFSRVGWAYESIAYALTLKHVGVMLQSMYLVATSMGLAGCALGVGNSDAFAQATGLDYSVEGSVGEFALGTPVGPPG